MRLIALEANRPEFRTIRFNPSGISVILAERHTRDAGDTKTTNGVGKTLFFRLLHFCLGSKKEPQFERSLAGWKFRLRVELLGRERVIERGTDGQQPILIDGQTVSQKEFSELLLGDWLDEDSHDSKITFRALASLVFRTGQGAYMVYDHGSVKEGNDAVSRLRREAFLLGLDLQLLHAKAALRKRSEEIKDTLKALKNDPLFFEFDGKGAVIGEMHELASELDKLEHDLATFQVSEHYDDIESDANRIKRQRDEVAKQAALTEIAISQTAESLKSGADIATGQVIKVYEEAKRVLPEMVVRRIEDVQKFHQDLAHLREHRLSKDLAELKARLRDLESKGRALGMELDRLLGYLNTHTALDEFVKVSNQASEKRGRLAHLQNSIEMQERADRELMRIQSQMAVENEKTQDYLDASRANINGADELFRRFAKRLYGNRAAALTVDNNHKDNLLRYDIRIHIEGDASDGINEAKIFCHDMTCWSLCRNHRLSVWGHDNNLFTPVDPRQRLAMLEVAREVCAAKSGRQYIVALNSHELDEIRTVDHEHAARVEAVLAESAVVLRLTDESPSSRLLGREVDIRLGDDTAGSGAASKRRKTQQTDADSAEVSEDGSHPFD